MMLYLYYAWLNPDKAYFTPDCCIRYPSAVPFECDPERPLLRDVVSGSNYFLLYFKINFFIAFFAALTSGGAIFFKHVQPNESYKKCSQLMLVVLVFLWFVMLIVGSEWRFSFAGRACAGEMYYNRLSFVAVFARRKASLRIFPPGTDKVSIKE